MQSATNRAELTFRAGSGRNARLKKDFREYAPIVAVLSTMAWTRPREYGFLLYAILAAAAHGVAHDHVTATISPEYFLLGKGLAESSEPFRWAVTLLAIRASCGTGLLLGAALLVANNPRRGGQPPRLPYGALVKLSLVPLALAAVVALVAGLVNARAQLGVETAALLGVVPGRVRSFVIVWAIHAGSYAGALLGTVVSVVVIVARRGARSPASAPA